MAKKRSLEEIIKERGFFWQSAEIYEPIAGFYDYGHLGTKIKRKWDNLWRRFFLNLHENFHEIEVSFIQPKDVFVASGHLKSFVDPVAKCSKCGFSVRADELLEEVLKEKFEGLSPRELKKIIEKHNITCPKCKGKFESVSVINMMFPIKVGVGNEQREAYLLPETAQGAYLNFKREFNCLRKKLPLGLAIIGKAFRNEISPRNLLLRMREFTQAELQIFFDPKKIDEHEDFKSVSNINVNIKRVNDETREMKITELGLPKFYLYYLAKIWEFYTHCVCFPEERIRFRELGEEERAFYNKIHFDVEINMPSFGWREVAGLHYRTDHDLSGHQKLSNVSMEVVVENRKFVPHVLEISMGVDRNVLALLDVFYTEEKERSLIRFPKHLAPYDIAVFPLVSKDGLPEKAMEIKEMLACDFDVVYDEKDSIGRRYRRVDEIGVPLAVTIDYETMKNDTVTIRDRDSMKQIRVEIKKLKETLQNILRNVENPF